MTSPFFGSGLGGRPLFPRRDQPRAAVPTEPAGPSGSAPYGAVAQWRAATEGPEQREIAGQIYTRLKAGASVDEVTDLVGRLRQSVTRRARGVQEGRL